MNWNLEEARHKNYRIFEPVKAGDYEISIQASTGHYCSPKAMLPVEEYTTFEIAIFKDGEFINPNKEFPNELWTKLFSNEESSIAGWVFKETIEVIYERLLFLSRK